MPQNSSNRSTSALLKNLQNLNAQELRRLLAEHLTRQKLGLYWECNAIDRDAALNANIVLPRVVPELGHAPQGLTHHRNLIIEGDNFDSLRLAARHAWRQPDKNLCRDVCAERLRRVITGYGGKPGYSVAQGGEFAYLQLDKIEAADVAFDATPAHAATLLCMQKAAVAPVSIAQAAIQTIAIGSDWLMVLCPEVSPQVLDALCTLPERHRVARLVVYAPRPKALAHLLAERGVEAVTYSIADALLQAQGRSKNTALA